MKCIRAPYAPTPWKSEQLPCSCENDPESPHYRVVDANWDFVCATNENGPHDVQESIAALVADSPELLNALEFLVNIMHDYESSVRKGYVKHALELAQAALKTAVTLRIIWREHLNDKWRREKLTLLRCETSRDGKNSPSP